MISILSFSFCVLIFVLGLGGLFTVMLEMMGTDGEKELHVLQFDAHAWLVSELDLHLQYIGQSWIEGPRKSRQYDGDGDMMNI